MTRVWIGSISLLAMLVGFFESPAWAGGWEHINTKKGVKVFSKEVEGSPLLAFKGVTTVDAPLQKVLFVIATNERRQEWVDRLYINKQIETVSPFEYTVYQAFKLPAIISNSDYVYKAKAVMNKDGSVRLKLASIKSRKAPKTVGVRANLVGSSYLLTPVDGGAKTRVVVEIHTDPKGLLPKWLVNLIQKSWPWKTLSGVKRQVKKDYVKEYPLPPAS